MKYLAQMPHEFIAHPIGTRSEELNDQHFAVAIDDDAGKSVAIAIDEAIAIGVVANDQLCAARGRRAIGDR